MSSRRQVTCLVCAHTSDAAEAVAEIALEMQEVVAGYRTSSGEALRLRIGINIGPVVAGVIGRRKFTYDLWGNTVNTASRMESHGVPGQIQVTPNAYERLRQHYRFEPREPVEVKRQRADHSIPPLGPRGRSWPPGGSARAGPRYELIPGIGTPNATDASPGGAFCGWA